MDENQQNRPTLNAQATAVVAYLSIVGWLVAYVLGDRKGAKHHLNYALVLAICTIALPIIQATFGVSMLLSYSSIMWPMWIARIASLVVFVGWIIGLVQAIKGSPKPLPFIDTARFLN